MLDSYIKDNFAKIFATEPIAEDQRRSGFNGSIIQVDLSVPTDHVDEVNLIVLNDESQMDLTKSIAYCIWMNGGKDNGLKNVTPSIMSKSAKRIGQLAVIWSFLSLFAGTDLKGGVRNSDTTELPFDCEVWEVLPADVGAPGGQDESKDDPDADVLDEVGLSDAAAAGVSTAARSAERKPKRAGVVPDGHVVVDHPVWLAAKKMEMYFMDARNKKAQEIIAYQAKFILHALVAVGIHRETCEGHSWYTSDTLKEGTNTFRAGAVAGAAHSEFRGFMKEDGHDVWHMLPNETLKEVCNALAITGGADEGDAKLVTKDIQYNGANVNGKALHKILSLSEAAIDRWPVGTLGKASVILGVGLIITMCDSLSTRMFIQGASGVIIHLKSIRDTVAQVDASKTVIKACRAVLPEPIVFAAGYLSVTAAGKVHEKGSIDALVKKHDDVFKSGMDFGTTVLQAPIHQKALAGAIAAKFNDFGSLGVSIAAIDATVSIPKAATITEVEIGEDEATVAHKRMLEMLQKNED